MAIGDKCQKEKIKKYNVGRCKFSILDRVVKCEFSE